MSINMTLPANLLVKSPTQGIFSYEFFKNIKAFREAGIIGSGPENIFQLDYQSLESYGSAGEFVDREVLKPISGLIARRDYANGGTEISPSIIESRNDDGVRIFFRSFVDIGEDAGKISIVKKERLMSHFAEQTALEAKATMQKYLFGIVKACIGGMTSAAHTYSVWNDSVPVTLTTPILAIGRSKLADKASEYIGQGRGLYVMHSAAEADLAGSQITSNLFQIVRDVVTSGSPMTYGAPYISVDDVYTFTPGSGTTPTHALATTLGLGKGIASVQLEEPTFYETDQRLNYETSANLLRADFAMTINVPGFAWDKVNGGANPTYATVTNSAYWVPQYSDHREVHGVLINTNVTGQ